MKKYLLTALLILFLPMASFAEIANEARLDYNKGVDYYKIGQYEKAAKYFRSAINISPDFIDAYYNLGSILEYLKQYDAALSVFQQIVIRNPDDYESVYKAASIAYQLGKYEEALKYTTLIPRSANEYDLSNKLASKIKNTTRRPAQINVPLSTIDTSTLPNSSYLFEGIQGPTGMVTDDFGNLYVACYADNAVTKIFPDGRRVIYVKDKKINGPIGLAMDVYGNLYVANYGNDNILKVNKRGEVSVLLGNVKKPYGLYLKGNMLFVSSQGSNSVIRYKLKN